MEIFSIVRSCQIFSSLDDATIIQLSKQFTPIVLRKNATLFRQGNLSDGIFVVASGKLVVLLKTATHPAKMLGDVHPGETLGEAGTISQEPRAATAKALENSTLLKLSREAFCKICNEYPAVMLAVMNVMVHRSRNLTELFKTTAVPKKHIVFMPANKKENLQTFTTKIQQHTSARTGMAIVIDADPEFHKKYHTIALLKQFIDELATKNEKILYILTCEETPLAKICLDKMDMLYVVANAAPEAHLDTHTLKQTKNEELHYKSTPELILLHNDNKSLPNNTRRWLRLAKFGLQHHVRLAEEKDWQRIVRFIRSEAIGLVLGGGGVRGWAHVGALQALTEAGIPIDAVGGASGGAIVAGYYALHGSYADAHIELQQLSEITSETMRLKGLTWPAVSLFSSAKYTKQLQKIFGRRRMENLWLPLFCVTCNLAKSSSVIHRQGLAWKKIRGSTAVPGVYPPVVMNGELHLDGGIVNNLPVGAMRKLSGNIGTVIAVELIHNIVNEKKYRFPPILNFWQTLLAKLRIIHKDYHFPQLVDTFLRALLVGSAVKQNESAKAADVLVSPDLSAFSLMKVNKKEQAQLIALGYQSTMKALKKWQQHPH